MRLYITNQRDFDAAIAAGSFAVATYVHLYNLPLVTALPDMPRATKVRLYNLPLVTALPDMPCATSVELYNLPLVTALPDMPCATYVHLYNLPLATGPFTVGKTRWTAIAYGAPFTLARSDDGAFWAGCQRFANAADALNHWNRADERARAFTAAINNPATN